MLKEDGSCSSREPGRRWTAPGVVSGQRCRLHEKLFFWQGVSREQIMGRCSMGCGEEGACVRVAVKTMLQSSRPRSSCCQPPSILKNKCTLKQTHNTHPGQDTIPNPGIVCREHTRVFHAP